MKQWWYGLNSREHKLLIAAMVMVFAGILYWGLWQPLDRRLHQARTSAQAQQSTLAWLRQQADRVVALRARGYGMSEKNEQPLTQIVTSTSGRFGIQPSRMQQQGDRVQLWVDSVRFDHLLRWLEQLRQDHGVTIAVIELSAEEAPGLVKVRRLELSKGE